MHRKVHRREFLSVMGLVCATARVPAARSEPAPHVLWGACQGMDRQEALKNAGFDFIEGSVGSLLTPSKSDEEFEAAISKIDRVLPIRSCTGFIPGSLPVVGPSVNREALLQHARITFQRAHRLGISYIVFGSGGARKIPDGFDPARAREQFIELARAMGPLAQDAGVTIVLEPLNRSETNFFHTVAEGIELVDAVGHPNVQLLADIYHMQRENEGPESLLRAGARLRHCHIAEKRNRTPPGTEGDDFRPFFRALKQIGYRGGISIEGRWSKDPTTDYSRAIATLRQQYAEA